MKAFPRSTVSANGIDFSYIYQGNDRTADDNRPLALCLHGFPDINRTWRKLLPALAEAGYYAVAPNLRGYWPTSQALDGCYHPAAYVMDTVELIQALGFNKGPAVLIGHDMGARAALGAAQVAPQLVEKVVAISCPYGIEADEFSTRDAEQIRRSRYMRELLKDDAESRVRRNDFEYLKLLRSQWSHGWRCRKEEMDEITASFRRQGSVQAALAYYRALRGEDWNAHRRHVHTIQEILESTPIPVPTLLIHGEDDNRYGKEVFEAIADWFFPEGYRVMIDGVGHFPHLEKPGKLTLRRDTSSVSDDEENEEQTGEGVNDVILEFLGKAPDEKDEGATFQTY